MTTPSLRLPLREALLLAFAAALVLPCTADAKRKKDYSAKLYNGVSIEEYCSELLSVEAFDLTDEDLETCDERYKDELDSLDDVDLGDIDLGGSSGSSSDLDDDDDDEAASDEPKLSKKDIEAQRLAAEEAEKKRLEGLGIVDFGEESTEEAAADDDDEDLGDDFGDEDLDEDVDVFDGGDDTLIEDFDEGSGGAGLEDLDDFGEEEDEPKKKKKKKKKKGNSSSSSGFDDAMDIPDGLE